MAPSTLLNSLILLSEITAFRPQCQRTTASSDVVYRLFNRIRSSLGCKTCALFLIGTTRSAVLVTDKIDTWRRYSFLPDIWIHGFVGHFFILPGIVKSGTSRFLGVFIFGKRDCPAKSGTVGRSVI